MNWNNIRFFSIHLGNIHLLQCYCAKIYMLRIEILSQPWALFGSSEQISLIIVSVSLLKSESKVTVPKLWLLGTELSFVIGLCCSPNSHQTAFLCQEVQLQIYYLLKALRSLNLHQMLLKMNNRFLEIAAFWASGVIPAFLKHLTMVCANTVARRIDIFGNAFVLSNALHSRRTTLPR